MALVRAVSGGSQLEPAEVARRANELERLAHGTPSGIDATVIAWERPIVFEKGKEPVPLRVAAPFRLALGVLPREGTTATLVAGVRALKEKDPRAFEGLLDEVRAVVARARAALADGDVVELGKALDANQAVLQVLGVSTPATQRAWEALTAAGALGAKLSGAGGGGVVLALLGPKADPGRVLGALRASGALDCFVTEISAWRTPSPEAPTPEPP